MSADVVKVCVNYVITGRVQGVWFRDATRKQAQSLDITGWVRNNNNGDVEVLACGELQNVKKLAKWLWQGPLLAKVKDIKQQELPWEDHADFVISATDSRNLLA